MTTLGDVIDFVVSVCHCAPIARVADVAGRRRGDFQPNLSRRVTFLNLEIVLSTCWLKCRNSERTESVCICLQKRIYQRQAVCFAEWCQYFKKPGLSIFGSMIDSIQTSWKWPVQSWIPILQRWHFQACWISSVTRCDCYLRRPSSWIDSCFMYLS